MAKPEWGTKRTCQSCGAPFYDLNKKPIVCPKCGANYDIESQARPKRAAAVKTEEKSKRAKLPVAPIEEDVIDVDLGDEDDVFIEEDDIEGEEDVVEVVDDAAPDEEV